MTGIWEAFTRDAAGWRFAGVGVADLAEQFGTPLYVYDIDSICRNIAAYHAHGDTRRAVLHYAVKANGNLTLLAKMASLGLGFDIVSGGELARVLAAGGQAEKIVFSGVAKTDAEIDAALDAGIGCFNVESPQELAIIAERAARKGKVAPFAVRVNPDVDAKTHPYISTGLKDNKFGVNMADVPALYAKARENAFLRAVGISCHIGSQIVELAPFAEAMDSILALADQLLADGVPLQYVDIGGGLGVVTDQQVQVAGAGELCAMLLEKLGTRPLALHMQPGRSLVGNSGILLSKVVLCKTHENKRFLMLDAGMNDYMRPALYQVRPSMRNVSRDYEGGTADVVGPVCESTDTFARDYPIDGERGDIIALAGAGAYGSSMANTYNSRALPAEVAIEAGKVHLIRRRQNIADIWADDIALSPQKMA